MDADIEFKNIGEFGLSLLESLNFRFLSKLYSNNASSNIGCRIEINNLMVSSDGNCKLKFENTCVENSKLGMDLLLESLVEILEILPKEKRDYILNRLKLEMKDLKNKNEIGIIQQCKSYASVHNSINIKSFIYNNCSASYPSILSFINSGSVEANCLYKGIANGFSFPEDKKESIAINSILSQDLMSISKLSIFLLIASFIIVSFLILAKMKKISFTYNFSTTIKPPISSCIGI